MVSNSPTEVAPRQLKIFLCHDLRDKKDTVNTSGQLEKGIVIQLSEWLEAHNIDVWRSDKELAGGETWKHAIYDKAIPACDLFVICLTKNFVETTDGERHHEVDRALEIAKKKHPDPDNTFIIPIRIERVQYPGLEEKQYINYYKYPNFDIIVPVLEKKRKRLEDQEPITEKTVPRRNATLSTDRAGSSGVWNVPHSRNPHFTGRDELLDQLYQRLTPAGQNDPAKIGGAALTQPQAIKGLGGIGKTQIAIEFAYRSRDQGHYTHTLWVNAVSEETMVASFKAIAELLPSFSAKDETDHQKLVEAVKRWLERCEQRWLLIFDNADDLSLVKNYLPQQINGSVLLTTRDHAVRSLASSIEVKEMADWDAIRFLLRRAQGFELVSIEHVSDEEVEKVNEAENIVIALDRFPLALDQAGAYIEETGCNFADYLQMYQTHRKNLLAQRGVQITNYPDSVATTWSLSFLKVEQANPAAAELLRLCAFLAPDKIPEELIRDGTAQWSPPLQQAAANLFTFNKMMADLLKFSLVKRLSDAKAFSIHRLVQIVQMDRMEPEEQRQWAERVVRAVNSVFPWGMEPETWPQCLLYLPQAQACVSLIKDYTLAELEVADLLLKTARYLSSCTLDAQALPLFEQSLAIQQSLTIDKRDGDKFIDTLIDLGSVYSAVAMGEEATGYYERALEASKNTFGPEHPSVVRSLHHLAQHAGGAGNFQLQELLLQQALAIQEKMFGPEHHKVANLLDSLGLLYCYLDHSEQAEPLLQRALAIREHAFGPEHPEIAVSLQSLAVLYQRQGKYEQAVSHLQYALTIQEKVPSAGYLDMIHILGTLASLYEAQHKYEQAALLLQHHQPICEETLGLEHPTTKNLLTQLASVYCKQKQYEQAVFLLHRVQTIEEKTLVPENVHKATTLSSLAKLYQVQRKYEQAEVLFRRVLAAREKTFRGDSNDNRTFTLLWSAVSDLASLYREQEKYEQAKLLYEHALLIYEQQVGAGNLDSAQRLNNLADFCRNQGRHAEAEFLYQRALTIREQQLRTIHPDTTRSLKNLTAPGQV